MTRPVFVVGGAGYIGAQTCKALAQDGFEPVVFDNLSTGHREFVRWGPLIEGDVRDTGLLADALNRHRPIAVLHFAACAEVAESMRDPERYYSNNVTGMVSLLRAMRQNGCDRLVFSSSCSVYGDQGSDAIDEMTVPDPINTYGRTKWMAEQMLADFGAAYGLRSIALRYFNACGADLDAEIGELHDPETHLIPRALFAALGLADAFSVFGTDYPTDDGSAVRDFVHVVDLADAHVTAVRHLLDGRPGGVFNLGTGTGHSVRAVADCVRRVTARPLAVVEAPRRPGDPATLIADPSRARAELGVEPRHSDLETIVGTAWRWHQEAHRARADATPADAVRSLQKA